MVREHSSRLDLPTGIYLTMSASRLPESSKPQPVVDKNDDDNGSDRRSPFPTYSPYSSSLCSSDFDGSDRRRSYSPTNSWYSSSPSNGADNRYASYSFPIDVGYLYLTMSTVRLGNSRQLQPVAYDNDDGNGSNGWDSYSPTNSWYTSSPSDDDDDRSRFEDTSSFSTRDDRYYSGVIPPRR